MGHYDWPAKKILDFSWSKKTEITFITKLVFGKIFMSVFSNLLLFYWQNLNIFLKFTNVSIRKEKKTLTQQSIRKKKMRKVGPCLVTGCFIKPFKMIINHFFLFLKLISQCSFCFLISGISKGEAGNNK